MLSNRKTRNCRISQIRHYVATCTGKIGKAHFDHGISSWAKLLVTHTRFFSDMMFPYHHSNFSRHNQVRRILPQHLEWHVINEMQSNIFTLKSCTYKHALSAETNMSTLQCTGKTWKMHFCLNQLEAVHRNVGLILFMNQ